MANNRATEHTPLITTVVVAPSRPRYSHSTIRRFCSIALGTTLIVVIILFLVPARYLPGNNTESEWSGKNHGSYLPWYSPYKNKGLSYKELTEVLLETPKPEKAREWQQYYTAGPHLAGKNLSQAEWTRDRWEEFGVKSGIVDYDVYLNYPLGHRLALLKRVGEEKTAFADGREAELVPSRKDTANNQGAYEVKYECSLEEDALPEDPTTGLDNRVPTFHGYSASGNVTAQYVYVNFGTYQDFEDLVQANVTLKGNIAIAKYGRIFRGLKVKRAQDLGMVGIVLYTDPQSDGEVTEENGYETYPNGPARNPSSVQRGSTQFLSFLPGDPTTPGYPSKPGVPRQDPHNGIPAIPSVPISYKDALPILRALNGHGPKAEDFNQYWQGGGLGYKGVEYNIGPSPADLVLNLVNEQEYVTTPIWDVIGIINGTLQDEVIVLGNHRDAWIAGGAGDPNSGSAAMNEVVRSFGVALSKGWKPLRTIVFASWDGEEYGVVGSTEWVEEYLPWLSKAAIAYLNVDVAAVGSVFTPGAAPLLHKALYGAASMVQSPNQSIPGQTVRDLWNGHIKTLGSGSDFTAFQDFAGIPSVDLCFTSGPRDAVYHYHSDYDSFAWMDKYGDPDRTHHIAMAKIWALIAAALVETPIIAFNATDYAVALDTYLHSVKNLTASSPHESIRSLPSLTLLENAISRLQDASAIFDARAAVIASEITEGVPWWRCWSKTKLYAEAQKINRGYKYLDRNFLYKKGLDGRSWFKHVVYAPGIWTGYAGATFPGLIESVNNGDREGVERWSRIIEGNINAATKSLE